MIIIPMAGLSSRFTRDGYKQPKYMLPLHGESVFYHAIQSFAHYFNTIPFLFIARNIQGTYEFIRQEIYKLKIKNFHIIMLESVTSGQAETVELGIIKAKISPLEAITIFNIDTFRKNFSFPNEKWFAHSDGYVEVFKGQGENWSYVKPHLNYNEPIILETAEKKPISDLCSNGLYHFAKCRDFLDALDEERKRKSATELYIAPLYNHLIKKEKKIHYQIIPKQFITFCGVPSEYELLLKEKF